MSKKNSSAENIKVLVRCRPLSDKEKGNGHKNCVEMNMPANSVSVKSLVGEADRWTFDAVINNTFSQQDIFTQYILPLVNSVLGGFNATVFAYGQSGSGKTHTMSGVIGDPEMEGVIPRCFKKIFESIAEMKTSTPNKSFSMYVSFVELYNGKVRDLLAKQQVTLDVRQNKDGTFFVQGVHVPQVKFPEDIIRLMEEGTNRRQVASTELNADSSRSHSLFTLIMECTETLEDGTATSVTSKLNLVDLAGSERQGKTGASGDTLKEGCNINLSLSALGTVIDCLVKGVPHVPFRSSPLTMLLKDSLGGNSKTVMFANINPSEKNLSETVSTLRFADRAKQIKNKPVINMDSKDQKIAELSALVAELREKLKKYETEGTESLEQEVEKLREQMGELEVNLDNAVKGREADSVDYQNTQAKLAAERQTFNAQLVEMEEQLTQLRSDLQVAESTAKDERTQREEVLDLCAKHLREGKAIANVDELDAVLKDKSHGANSAEMAQLNTQVQTLTAEKKRAVKDLKATKSELEAKLKETKEAAKKAESRMKKMAKELAASREAQKKLEEAAAAASPRSVTPGVMQEASTEEVKVLQAAVAETQSQLDSSELLQKIDKRLAALVKQQEELIAGTGKELAAAMEQMSKPASGEEGDMLQQFRAVAVSAQTKEQLALILSLYELVRQMRSGWRQAHAVPMAILSGDYNAAQKAIADMETVDGQAADAHAQVIQKLSADISKAYLQRNAILELIASSHPEITVDVKKEVRTVLTENDELRTKCETLSTEKEEMHQQVVEEQRSAAAKETLVKASADASAKQAAATLQADFAAKQQAMLDTVKVDDNGASAMKVLRDEIEQLRAEAEQRANATATVSTEELDAAKAELEEARGQVEAMQKARDELYEQLTAQRKEAGEAEERAAELAGKMNELEKDCERRLAAAASSGEEVVRLEARLHERAEQLDQMRTLLEKQKRIIVNSNEKAEHLAEKLREAQADAENREESQREALEERDANTQRLINERLAEYAELRQEEVQDANKKHKKLKKKLQKMQEAMADMETEFDKKVLECEELRQVLGEQKVEQLRMQRRLEEGDEEVEIFDQRGNIQSALELAKEERRRKADLFALGEVQSAKRTASRMGRSTSSRDALI